jgi:lipase maturation factor 1
MSRPIATLRRPLVIYDGDCGVCRACIAWLRRRDGEALAFMPLQSPQAACLGIPLERLRLSIHLLEPDGSVFSAAAAALQLLARDPRHARWLRWYERDATFAELSEGLYAWVARNRGTLSGLLRWFGPREFAGAACRLPQGTVAAPS